MRKRRSGFGEVDIDEGQAREKLSRGMFVVHGMFVHGMFVVQGVANPLDAERRFRTQGNLKQVKINFKLASLNFVCLP